jgi:hypothetical protein
MIKYKEVLDRGFKRLELGSDNVFFNEHGYEWFVAEKVIQKLNKGKLVATWCPETKTIELMKIINGDVIGRKTLKTIYEFDKIDVFFNPTKI